MTDFMFDLETLDNKPTSVIVDDEVKEFYSERVGNDNLMNVV